MAATVTVYTTSRTAQLSACARMLWARHQMQTLNRP